MLRDKRLIESDLAIVRWLRGEPHAFEAIVKLWERSLFYYVRRLVPSEPDAWEVLQETWLKILRSGKSLRDPAAFPAFLYRVARNAAVSRLRKPDLVWQELGAEHLSAVDEGNAGDDFDAADEVHSALDQLPLPQREVLTLFFLKELSLHQIATLLEIPVGTVKSRLHHARRAMRQLLEQRGHHV